MINPPVSLFSAWRNLEPSGSSKWKVIKLWSWHPYFVPAGRNSKAGWSFQDIWMVLFFLKLALSSMIFLNYFTGKFSNNRSRKNSNSGICCVLHSIARLTMENFYYFWNLGRRIRTKKVQWGLEFLWNSLGVYLWWETNARFSALPWRLPGGCLLYTSPSPRD